jgi:hypothetical protein
MFRNAMTATVLVLCLAASSALASIITYTPSPADLGDLDHTLVYTWGINTTWNPATDVVSSVTLTFKNIYNWDDEPNVLNIHLLDSGTLGVTTKSDNQGGGDNFAGQGVLLKKYTNLSTHARTLVYTFTTEQVATLNAYAADGRFALGLDPDCHFYNSGVSLCLITDAIQLPEPMTLTGVATGFAAMLIRRRK